MTNILHILLLVDTVDAIEHFFWNMKEGVVLELGALDGSNATKSQSLLFEEEFGWHRILIEGNPKYRDKLSAQSKAFSVNSAICNKRQMVHYAINQKHEMTSGIVEFMTWAHLKRYFKPLYNNARRHGVPMSNNTSWHDMSFPGINIVPIPCLPLGEILSDSGVKRINLMLLDVEGAERLVLDSMNLSQCQVDLFIIEMNVAKDVSIFFKDKPYKLVATRGRNVWYQHERFVPSQRPELNSGCYRGSVKSGVLPRKHATYCKAS